jgi:CRISPR-associated protein Cas1
MYLEWVQREFVDNHFTVDGRRVHRRADAPGGQLPPNQDNGNRPPKQGSTEPDRTYEARSLWLSSEALRLTAKVDIVEGDASGAVVPIEYKRGKVPDIPEGAYLPERAQLCAQALLLREHGYHCEEGAIYFAASRRRVAVPLTDALITETRRAIERALQLCERPVAPPPLTDSPKCHGCSLSGICLPDEVTLLDRLRGKPIAEPPEPAPDVTGECDPDPWDLVGPQPEPPRPVRRLYPARNDRVPLYVVDPRSRVRRSGHELIITGEGGATHVRLTNTSHVVVFGNAQITTQALRALFEHGISVTYLSGGGYLLGRASSVAANNIDLRIAQHRRADDPEFCLSIARALVAGKIKNSRTLLRRNTRPDPVAYKQLSQLARRADKATHLDSLLGLEGVAARTYFSCFTAMLKRSRNPGDFDLQARNRRPPRDPINALLSFAYSLLTRDATHAVAAVGMEPLLGFYHQPRFGKPALALDLMEEFRPLIADSVVITAINTGVVTRDDFTFAAGSCNLGAAGRRRFIAAYERRMDDEITHPWFGYRVSYRRILEVQARLLSRTVMGEIDTYPPFTTR